jgi:hypothetical protein
MKRIRVTTAQLQRMSLGRAIVHLAERNSGWRKYLMLRLGQPEQRLGQPEQF